MKILQLSPRFPLPPDDGGKIVLSNTFKYLSKLGNEVHLFCFEEDTIEEKLISEVQSMGKFFQYKYTPKNTASIALKSLCTNRSAYLAKHFSEKIFKQLCDIYEKEKYDIIHCEHSAMAVLGSKLKKKYGVPFSIRLHNIEYKIWELYAKQLKIYNPLKYFIEHQYRALRAAEKKLYALADVCFAITEDDRQAAATLSPTANVITSSVGVDLDKFPYSNSQEREPYTLILATTYKWVHNVDGIVWFIENVMPLVRQQIPSAKLRLLGKEPPERLYSYSDLGVEVIGYVEDVVPYLNKSSVYVAPLFVGAGIRIKIIEAMATGLPVVATKVSAAGINASAQDGLFISDSPQRTAAMVVNLLINSNLAEESGKKASQFVRNNFSWEGNVKIMQDYYYKICGS